MLIGKGIGRKNSVVTMKPYSFVYNKEEYDFHNFKEEIDLSNCNMKIVMAEEQLFIKIFEVNNDIKKILSFIQDKIDNIFPQNGEILYDYEKNNDNNLLAIYSIKGKKRIEKLSQNANNLEVKPIQLIVKKSLIKKLKNKNLSCSVIFKFEDSFYYLKIDKGLLYENHISENLYIVLDKVLKDDISELYIDQNIDYTKLHIDNIRFIKLNMEELVYDKLFKK